MLAAAALDALGVAGYRGGGVGATGGLFAVAVVAGLVLLRRNPWLFGAPILVASLAAGLLIDRAPWSTGRLEAALDDLEHLDGFEIIETERDGHSWCRPDCPRVTRVYRAPDTSPRASVVTMAVSLANAGLIPPLAQLGDRVLTDELDVRGDDADVIVSAERLEPGDLRVTVILSSRRSR